MSIKVEMRGDWDAFDKELISLLGTPDAVLGVTVPDEQHPGPRAQKHPVTYRTIAWINEHGDAQRPFPIPARPIFGPAMEKNSDSYLEHLQGALVDAVHGRDWEESLAEIADLMVEHVQDEIDDWEHQTPLADRTVARKGHEQPWVEGGHLREALQGHVKLKAVQFSHEARRFRNSKGQFTRVAGR